MSAQYPQPDAAPVRSDRGLYRRSGFKPLQQAEAGAEVIAGFNGLRGFAVIFVMLYHWFPNDIRGGYLGVVLFLALSGYLVTSDMLTAFYQKGGISVWSFYKRRFKRLYPPLIFCLLLVNAWIFVAQRGLLANFAGYASSTLLGYNNWWQIVQSFSYFDQHGNFNVLTHMWTLSLEFQIYLIWPVVVSVLGFFAKRRLRRYLLLFSLLTAVLSGLAMLILFAVSRDVSRIYYGTDTRFFAFALGAALACLMNRRQLAGLTDRLDRRLVTRASAVTLVLMFAMMLVLPGNTAPVYCGLMFLFAVIAVVFMATAADRRCWVSRLLGGRLIGWFGSRSYALYLWQYTVMIIFKDALKYSKMGYGRSVLIQVPIILILAELTHQLTEKRAARVWRRMIAGPSVRSGRRSGQAGLAARLTALLLAAGLTTMFVISLATAQAAGDRDELAARLNGQARNGSGVVSTLGIQAPMSDLMESYQRAAGIEKLRTLESSDLAELFANAVQAFPDLKLTDEEEIWLRQTSITDIGDSISESCRAELTHIMPKLELDAAVSRQVEAGLDVMKAFKDNQMLRHTVIFALGTNGVIDSDMLRQLGEGYPEYRIYLVSIVQPDADVEKRVNTVIRQAADQYDNLFLIDWYDFAKTQRDIFYNDGTHPNASGAAVYAQYLAKHVAAGEITAAAGIRQAAAAVPDAAAGDNAAPGAES